MRKKLLCAQMTALLLLLCACGGGGQDAADTAREPYRTMTTCSMEAEVTCGQGDEAMTYTLHCDYTADGASTVEVLVPDTVKGVKATVDGENLTLTYEDECLNAGTLGSEQISPAVCLPLLMNALRDGWLLEQSQETLHEVPCLRLAVDQTGEQGGKIISTLWLRQDDGTPLRGEITVDDEIILQVEFTKFAFGDILQN